MTSKQRLLDEIANRPPKPDGYEQRLVADQQTDADLEYEVTSYLTRPDSRRNKVDMDVREARKILEKAEEVQRRYYQSAGITEPPSSLSPTREATETFGDGIITASDFLDVPIPEQTYLVDGMIPQGGLGLLLASQKTGKSLFAVDCGIAVARGEPFFGRETKQSNVLIIEQEGAPYQFQRRVRTISGGNAPSNLYLRHRKAMNLRDPEHLAGLRGWIEEHAIGLVFVGPLAQTGNIADENQASGFNDMATGLNEIITATGATIFVIHHRRKSGNDSYHTVDEMFETSRGSNSLTGSIDTGIGLMRAQEAKIGRMYVLQREAPSWIANYAFDTETLRITPTDEEPRSAASASERHEAAAINWMLRIDRPFTRAEMQAELKMSDQIAARTLTSLRTNEKVEMTGSSKATRYQLEPAFRERMLANPRDASGVTSLNQEALA